LRWGGFLKDVGWFDADFFHIAPGEAESMDPQQRLLLEVAWEAIENGGITRESLKGCQAGLFIGISSNDYAKRTASTLEIFQLVSIRKRCFSPNSSLCSEFHPRNINYMPAAKFFTRLDLEKNPSFRDGN
jgi:acyl transferase domain-containing protein